jgi:hypothetical protein
VKLGASATSPGVTARWEYVSAGWARLVQLGVLEDDNILGCVVLYGPPRSWGGYNSVEGGHMPQPFTHRYQAKRAVEAAVSQALREAVE